MNLKEIKNKYSFPLYNPTYKNFYYGHRIKNIKDNFNKNIVQDSLGNHIKLIVDFCAFLGRSTNFLIKNCPNAHIISVDEWLEYDKFSSDEMFEFFVGFLYYYRYSVSIIKDNIYNAIEILKDIREDVDIVNINRYIGNELLQSIIDIFPNALIFMHDNIFPNALTFMYDFNNEINTDREIIHYEKSCKIRKKPIFDELMKCEIKNHPKQSRNEECFIINIYNDKTIEMCVENIRKYYPDSNILLINDGDQNSYLELSKKYNLFYCEGSQIKQQKYKLLWWQRICWLCLEVFKFKSKYFIKMDPDTKLLKKIDEYPNYDYFGNHSFICRAGFIYKEVIQGFCKVLTKRFLTTLYESNLCLDDKYLHSDFRREVTNQISEDKVLLDICKKLNINWGNWKNVSFSYYGENNMVAVTNLDTNHNPIRCDIARYWKKRINMLYYKKISEIIKDLKPCSILDVGNGGCPYIDVEFANDILAIDIEYAYSSKRVKPLICDFLEWENDKKYDLVICSQVLEHIKEVEIFTQKLFECGINILITVPYNWPKEIEKQHINDPIDENKLKLWTKRDPIHSCIVTENVRRKKKRKDISRIICMYN